MPLVGRTGLEQVVGRLGMIKGILDNPSPKIARPCYVSTFNNPCVQAYSKTGSVSKLA